MIVPNNVLPAAPAIAATDTDPQETVEWLESLEAIIDLQGTDRARFILDVLMQRAGRDGIRLPSGITTSYTNTISPDDQIPFPGNRELERRVKNIIRWNAMAMVQRANKKTNVGGHISTFASAATLYEIGFNHFWRGRTADHPGDIVFFQGHASPGMYSRAFLEGRLSETNLNNFRQELQEGGGLSSYPHPWLMPNFWQYPSVSMGLAPIMSLYQARFIHYLHDRNLLNTDDVRVWAFLGDGECDEVETLGAINFAARERLDNLCWVINCNLQRLDGPVRGNFKIIQELEGSFRGAGWNVIKVVWSGMWDALLNNDKTGALVRRMGEVVDGQYQEYAYSRRGPDGKVIDNSDYIRNHFFNTPELKAMVEHLSGQQVRDLFLNGRGGHDPQKVYAAYKAATEHKGAPTVILIKTVKGYHIPGGTAANTTHQKKTLAPDEVVMMRNVLGIPIPDADLDKMPFYKPGENSPEMEYLRARRRELGGYVPYRHNEFLPCNPPAGTSFARLHEGSGEAGKTQSTTLAWVTLMGGLMKDPEIGRLIVPIVPDEGQTFGMPPLYKAFGIYSSVGQLYAPVDKGTLTEYRESRTGQIMQEGINEAGAMCSFIAAGTSYSTHGINTIPFYIYYSMFGFQRVGDLIWAAADSRCKGFLMGATAGRTTLNGEGLQHEDGHSHLAAMTVPNCRSYDPAFAYELAVIIEDGIDKMYVRGDDVFYYITVYNENYLMPRLPEGAKDGIVRGMYPFKTVKPEGSKLTVQLLGSGVIINEVLRAQEILATKYKVASTVFSVTSYTELRRDYLEVERFNRLHPEAAARRTYVEEVLGSTPGPVIASSDYMRSLPELISPCLKGRLLALGTDGFGRSETRPMLRRFFEIDAESVVVSALYALAERGELDRHVVTVAIQELGLDVESADPWTR